MSCAVAALTSWTGVTYNSEIVPLCIYWVSVDLSPIQGFSFFACQNVLQPSTFTCASGTYCRCDAVFQDHALTEYWLLESSCCVIIIIVIIIIISALESISQVKQSAFWVEYKSNWIKWNQMKHWFFWWGENRSTGENLLKHSRKRGNSTHLQCWVWNLEHRFEWWIRTSPTLFPVPWLCFWCDLVT